ncbi:helix-turn-helix transcriptional regulator [Amycolatopsis tolypomycina]|uniref:Predicted DNA-binding transcriptional regulator YafY, contains an HTH and WYL domains n=1 Tax=Amycolatopsis tolypomycina TaxID=208445 RepID=A0A1H4YMU5_9PSEU|nr:YafY family protein [Amycolatopsis tolypomycina]SED18985.1 Predicted DNA-binding transcriptional regulator YafY, contains an HTH and WYL domains [Amycolatopsis tolypomycina]
MTDTPARLLGLLSLLQTPREWPGSELAERLGVSPRTIRRDIERLRDLGYPVEASRGVAGGYRLVAGTAMPPLVLDDEEAVAIAVGLRTAAGQTIDGIEEASVRALAKLEQVLPARLRRRVGTIGTATVAVPATGPVVDPAQLTVFAGAITNHETVRFRYRAHDGTETRRRAEPLRLVAAGRRWYLVAYDLDRADWRVFRADRVREAQATGGRVARREPPATDLAAYVLDRFYDLAPSYRAVAVLAEPAAQIAPRLGPATGELTDLGDGRCRWRSHEDTVEWLAFRLLGLGCSFTVEEPPELIERLKVMAAHAAAAVPD